MFITYMVIDRLVQHLTLKMITEVSPADQGRVDVVKFGRFQDNPSTQSKNIYLSVSGGSQTDTELVDGIVSIKEQDRIGMNVPPREVGGGQLWWRRGEVKIGVFTGALTSKLTEEQAGSLAYDIFGRLQANIENCRVGGLVDSYGERALALYCFASSFMESGGKGAYFWRGSVKWQFLSERP